MVHLAGDDPLPFPRQLVRITIPSHHWQQRKIFAKQELSGWDSAPTPEHAENLAGAAGRSGGPGDGADPGRGVLDGLP